MNSDCWLPTHLKHIYTIDEFRLHFGGVRLFGKFANGWIGEKYLADFSTRLRTLSNIFFNKHPNVLRNSTVNNDAGTTPSSLDRPSKLLYIADENLFCDILERQENYVRQGETREHQAELRKLLHAKINNMKHRSLMKSLVFGGVWEHLPGLLQDRLDSGFEGCDQYFYVNFTHNPVNRHMDKAGFAENDSFTGAGKSIATMQLEGHPCHIFLQEIPSRAAGRFPGYKRPYQSPLHGSKRPPAPFHSLHRQCWLQYVIDF